MKQKNAVIVVYKNIEDTDDPYVSHAKTDAVICQNDSLQVASGNGSYIDESEMAAIAASLDAIKDTETVTIICRNQDAYDALRELADKSVHEINEGDSRLWYLMNKQKTVLCHDSDSKIENIKSAVMRELVESKKDTSRCDYCGTYGDYVW